MEKFIDIGWWIIVKITGSHFWLVIIVTWFQGWRNIWFGILDSSLMWRRQRRNHGPWKISVVHGLSTNMSWTKLLLWFCLFILAMPHASWYGQLFQQIFRCERMATAVYIGCRSHLDLWFELEMLLNCECWWEGNSRIEVRNWSDKSLFIIQSKFIHVFTWPSLLSLHIYLRLDTYATFSTLCRFLVMVKAW